MFTVCVVTIYALCLTLETELDQREWCRQISKY